MQKFVHCFERAEKSSKTILQMGRGWAHGREIALAKSIGKGNHRRPHRPVFVRAPRPNNALFGVNPNRKPHVAYGLFVNTTCASTG
jgi:hypothetical protein